MSEVKSRILIFSAALLLILSALAPMLLVFGTGGTALAAPALAGAEDMPEPLPGISESEREMRGLWIATVNNINFPSAQGLSAQALAEELDAIVAFAAENGFNTILFQVRPSADALYDSKMFPQSRFVSGRAGEAADGDFDCLAYLTGAARRADISVYAWINPLRVTTGSAAYPQTDRSALPESSPAALHPEWVESYADGKLYFNAGVPEVRQYVAEGVREVCENYTVDGIIFDDYFYPYPVSGAQFDDAAEYTAYGSGFASLEDFRRDNVNQLVRLCYETVKSVDPSLRFGVSPFGIWKNSDGQNGGSATRGLSAYNSIYCDALAWVAGGYVDFLAPQLYWSFADTAAPFGTLCDWWSRALDSVGVDLYICHGVYRYAEGRMENGEMTAQVGYARKLHSYRGSLFYGYAALKEDAGGVRTEMREIFADDYMYPAYTDSGIPLQIDGYVSGQTVTEDAVLITGMSNPAYAVSVNGITPLREKSGRYSITLALAEGNNLITVACGSEKLELVLVRK